MPEVVSYQRVCGIDVAKDSLEVRIICGDLKKSLATSNDAHGFARIIELCRKHQVQIAVMEATGGYQRRLAVALAEAQLHVAVVNPGRVRFYALAEGLIAKTDKVDAQIIAMYAQKIAPKPTALRTAQQEELVCLVGRKAQLIQFKVAEANRLQQQADSFVLKSINRLLKLIDKEIQKIDDRLDALVRQDLQMQTKAQAADTVKGIGRASAVALVTLMPELGTLTSKQVAALAGLAPFNNDSGTSIGDRHIYGGRAPVRTVLYMCVLSAIRRDGTLRIFYERLVAGGKCKMKAITAVMRKMLVIANARVREALAALPATPPQAKEAAVAAAGG